MDGKLLLQGLGKYFAGVLMLGLLLFLPGGFGFWQGWMLMGILFIPMLIAGFVLMAKNPDLLRKRLNVNEQEKEQKQVILFSGILFAVAFIVAGLNFRFDLFVLRGPVCIGAAVAFLVFYALYAEVLRENTYLSRTVEVQEEQKVIDTGMYGIVRHPMYMVTVGLFLAMMLALGSLISFGIMLLYIPLIAKRIRNEEEVLMEGLPGYKAYMRKVRYRLIPFIW
ncbi:MAG: isoprenylcysteine carboxylmethyltransferase family protein [Oscillospiraceae bacterium]|nr:isoprenylcysteine carboxylmethyltransferase family protein [Oscillospiraceae bacterium]